MPPTIPMVTMRSAANAATRQSIRRIDGGLSCGGLEGEDRWQQGTHHRDAQRPAGCREHRVLDELKAHETPPRAADRSANRELAPPARHVPERQVEDVDRRENEQHHDRAGEREQSAAFGPVQRIAQPRDVRPRLFHG